MDLGISGRTAIVCGASSGLGRACADVLAREGVNLVICGRTPATIMRAAEDIARESGANVTPVVVDVTSEAGRAALLAACDSPDILVSNAGGPPAGDFRNWDRDIWVKALNDNMLTQIFLIKSVIDGMIERRFGRIINVTSSAVRSPFAYLGLSNASRAGLTGFISGLSRQVAKHNVIINNLLPSRFETERQLSGIRREAGNQSTTYEELYRKRQAEIPAGHLGDPEEFGRACAFLCSAHTRYIVGQNILMDGGLFATAT